MEYIINPMSFTGIFPVPNSLVDENIRLASVVQLKVILYMLRHSSDGNATTQGIAEALSLDKEDVRDAMIFWNERGILLKQGETPPLTNVTIVKEEKPEKEEKKVGDIPISRPTFEQVATRIKESDDFSYLCREAQTVLGKTIGYDGQSVLLMLYDSYGLPTEVILMAIEYAVSLKKTSHSHIARIGKRWSELEIDTIEGAIQYIEEHNIVDETWEKLRSLTEITNRHPTEKQRKYLAAWVKEYGFNVDMIYCAYEESIDNTGKMSIAYMDKIMRTWHKDGVKTLKDVQASRMKWKTENKSRFKKDKKKNAKDEGEASYDIDEYMKKSLNLQYVKNDGKGGA